MTRDDLLDKLEAVEYWQEEFAGKTFIKTLRAIIELHKPDLQAYDDGSGCTCNNEYPCATVLAIEKGLNL